MNTESKRPGSVSPRKKKEVSNEFKGVKVKEVKTAVRIEKERESKLEKIGHGVSKKSDSQTFVSNGPPSQRFFRNKVEFSVRGPVCVNLDENNKSQPGCSVIDLIFPEPSKVREIVFRNYYTAWITMLVQYPCKIDAPSTSHDNPMSPKWHVAILHRVLMKIPHWDEGAQDYISIPFFESAVDWDNLVAIRLVLRQPSPVWKTFHVEELDVYNDTLRYTQPPFVYYNQKGVVRHIQQYDNLLLLLIEQTNNALNMPDEKNENEDDKDKSKDKVKRYEFFSLPI